MRTKKLLLTAFVGAGLLWASGTEAQSCNVYAYDSLNFYCGNNPVNLYVSDPQGVGYVIYWGDGSTTPSSGNTWDNYQHVYTSSGIYFPYLLLNCGDTVTPQLYGFSYGANYYYISDSCAWITGKAYVDANGNCVYDNGDFPLINKTVIASQNNLVISMGVTDPNGDYSVIVGTGTYDITIQNIPSVLSLSCSSQNPATVNSGQSVDFVFTCSSPGHDLQANLSGWGFAQTTTSYLYLTVENAACQGVSSDISVSLDPQIVYLGGWSAFLDGMPYSNAPVISGNTLTFTGVPMGTWSVFSAWIGVQADTNTTIGDTLCVQLTALPTAGDYNPTDNTDNFCGLVLLSWDPNAKAVTINGMPAEGYVNNNQVMEYTIMFQNEGNFPAKDIRIEDVIDENTLDINTLHVVGSSHNMQVLIEGNKVVFYFPNIWLPDKNSNEPASHGYVKFTISQKPGLAPNTQIANTADIYFDYNPAVTTNTVISIIKATTGIEDYGTSELHVFPNPATEVIYLSNVSGEKMVVTLMNAMGQPVKQLSGNQSMSIEVGELAQGYYLMNVQMQNRTETFKVLIQR